MNLKDLLEEEKRIVINPLQDENPPLLVVITEGSTTLARALIYRILIDETFGPNQSIHFILYDSPNFLVFLESTAIEITACAPNLLEGISYSADSSIAFKDADVVFSIGRARGYEFTKNERRESFFEEYIHVAKIHGEAIERFAKKDVKIITLGYTAARIILQFAKSIPPENITALSLLTLKITAALIAAKANRHPSEVINLITWGVNGENSLPDYRYAKFRDGKFVEEEIKNDVWLKKDLIKGVRSASSRSWYSRSSAYALADHCKLLWNDTPEGEWTSMAIYSDNSYGVPTGIFFSFPVYCQNRKYKIVQGLDLSENLKKYMKETAKIINEESSIALNAHR